MLKNKVLPFFYVNLFLFVLLIRCNTTYAETFVKHQIAAAELSGLFNAPDMQMADKGSSPGVYQDLLALILHETGLEADYEIAVLPMKRAKMGFSRRQFACYAPGFDTFDLPERNALPKDILSSSAFNHAIVKVLSRHDNAIVKNANDISKNNVISLVRGVPINPQMQYMMDNSLKYYLVNSEYENLQMLISGRVDHILAFYPDILAAYKQLGINKHFPFDATFSPLIIKDNLICHKEHESAFKQIEAAILKYQQQGLLQKILHDYYLPAELL